jgi:hypothetical protein
MNDNKFSFLGAMLVSMFFGASAWALNGVIMAGFVLSPAPGTILPETWRNVGQALPAYCLVGTGLGFLFMIALRLRSVAEAGCFVPLLGGVGGIILGEIYGPIFHVTSAMPMDSIVWRGVAAFFGLMATLIAFQLSAGMTAKFTSH